MPTLPDSGVSFTVQTNGQTLIVAAGPSASALTAPLYSDAAVSSAVTLPHTITSDTTYYLPLDWANVPLYISVKQPDGSELWGKTQLVGGVTIAPLPSAAQVGVDVVRRDLALAPPGALAETYSRVGAAGSSQTAAVSGTLYMTAIYLPANTVVSSISYLSGGTGLSAGTNQWFALYTSARALIAQTANDTSTAWTGSAVKTLSFASPVTTTYSGLHYIGFLVTASTVPTFTGASSSAHVVAPITNGTSTTGLTDTAPATAGALTAIAGTPYAYVS